MTVAAFSSLRISLKTHHLHQASRAFCTKQAASERKQRKPASRRKKKFPAKIKYVLPGSSEVLVRRRDSDINREPYHIAGAIIVERTPVIHVPRSETEKKYLELRKKRDLSKKRDIPSIFRTTLPENHSFSFQNLKN